ncbi:hypothetical protein R6V09_25100 [Streptomyces sp. W16]|uniref:hypothetical protein n=1 Tax=Streptomyces sp. W16 TaxID=3076631 RepID=UPI00295A9463|nr:hypothetical protein [Streptomyces sp. W16]MDV9173367.1 hypothetical protein [Streptomyces sp. W16]
MRTNLREPLRRLPASAIPDGCVSWRGEHPRRWTRALPPHRMSVRLRLMHVKLAVLCGWLSAAALLYYGGLPPYLAAVLPLQVIWVLWRPEIVRYSATVLFIAVVGYASWSPHASWWVLGGVVLPALVLSVPPAEYRARARERQREAALAASEGITARLPDADRPVRRGRFLIRAGALLLVPGAVLTALAPLVPYAENQRAATMTGVHVIGLGLTVLLSGALGRQRARALRQTPAPVLRVLVRETVHGDTEVLAADDTAALRPLFRVAVSEPEDIADHTDKDPESPESPEDSVDALDALDDVDDADDLLDALDDALDGGPAAKRSGPLREAVLYGTPFDGAEILLVSAAPKPGRPPLTQWSTGPVRPLSESGVRRRLVREKREAVRAARNDARHEELVAAVRAESAGPVPVRRWRAGPVDWLATFLMAQCAVWLYWIATDESLWHRALLLVIGLRGATRIPVKLSWRITADRTGIWLKGLLRPRHIPWDDLRSARREGFDLKLRWRGGDCWVVAAPHSARLQRARGLTHPYDALAAELSAMIADPALRPTGESGEKERGRPLWPYAALLTVVWVALVAIRQGWL